MSVIKCQLTDKRAVIPTKNGFQSDIGYDLTCIGIYKHLSDRVTLYETAVKVSPPPGYYIEIIPRSSMSGSNYALANSIGVIDPTFRGSLKVALWKINPLIPDIEFPFTLCQIVLRKAEYTEIVQVESLDETDRGEGGFGSTNKK
jgi:dUTP pyrophosphatase